MLGSCIIIVSDMAPATAGLEFGGIPYAGGYGAGGSDVCIDICGGGPVVTAGWNTPGAGPGPE